VSGGGLTGDRAKGARARLFVALELPEAVRTELAGWAGAGLDERFRLVAPADLHVTLCFLGWRDEDEIEAIAHLAAGVARPVGGLGLSEPVWLPRRRPRVLAVGLQDGDGGLGELAGAVVGELVAHAGHVPEERPFRPHVSVARVRRPRGLTAQARPTLEDVPGAGEVFAASALTLQRSHLSPEGARYEALMRVEL
jgi:2'-5' RNA ligase